MGTLEAEERGARDDGDEGKESFFFLPYSYSPLPSSKC